MSTFSRNYLEIFGPEERRYFEKKKRSSPLEL
jgi:hypothetical protein